MFIRRYKSFCIEWDLSLMKYVEYFFTFCQCYLKSHCTDLKKKKNLEAIWCNLIKTSVNIFKPSRFFRINREECNLIRLFVITCWKKIFFYDFDDTFWGTKVHGFNEHPKIQWVYKKWFGCKKLLKFRIIGSAKVSKFFRYNFKNC